MNRGSVYLSLAGVVVCVALSVKLYPAGDSKESAEPMVVVSATPVPLASTPTPAAMIPSPVPTTEMLVTRSVRQDNNLWVEGDVGIDRNPSTETRKLKPPTWFMYRGAVLGEQRWVTVYRENEEAEYPVVYGASPSCTDSLLYRDLLFGSQKVVDGLTGAPFRGEASVKGDDYTSSRLEDYRIVVTFTEPYDKAWLERCRDTLSKEVGMDRARISFTLPPEKASTKYRWLEGRSGL